MRKVLVVIVSFLLISAGLSIYWALHTPLVAQMAGRHILKRQLPDYTLENFKISKQKFIWPGTFLWDGVSVKLRKQKEFYTVDIHQILLSGAETFLKGDAIIKLTLTGWDLRTESLTALKGKLSAQCHWPKKETSYSSGTFFWPEVTWGQMSLQDLNAAFKGVNTALEVKPLGARLYGGTLQGECRLNLTPALAYETTIRWEHLLPESLNKIFPVFDKLQGPLDGELNASGDKERLFSAEILAHIPQAGGIDAGLLSTLVDYIPPSKEREALKALIRSQGKLPVEVASVFLKTKTDESLSGVMKLESKKLNVKLNIPVDILLDGPLDNLLKSGSKISKLLQGKF